MIGNLTDIYHFNLNRDIPYKKRNKQAKPKTRQRQDALKSLYRSPGNKKNQLVLCKNYVLQW